MVSFITLQVVITEGCFQAVEGSPFLLFLSCLQCEKGSVRKGRMDQFSAMVAAFCYDKGCAWYTMGTSLLDVAGGSRSRIKPSFNNS